MIRPFTLVTLMLACTSGAYLFVVKHRAPGLDDRISSVTGQIRAAEQRIRVLQAEWAQENDPNRLAGLAARFTALKPMAPSQLTTIASLADILPPPGAGIPHLPLPPPPSWATPPASPPNNPAAGPVASAAPINPVPSFMMPVVTKSALLAPALPAPKPLGAARALARHLARHPARRRGSPLHHGFQYVATRLAQPSRLEPRLASALPYRSQPQPQPYQYRPHQDPHQNGETHSVFGSLGAELPPPQPVTRTPR